MKLTDVVRQLLGSPSLIGRLGREVEQVRLAVGRLESRRVRGATFPRLADAEFQVYSQFGQDGIIQYLIGKVPISNDMFVEFGVEDYRESNTRFLLCNDNWRGLILDASPDCRRFLSEQGLDWKYQIDALAAFITRENINDLLRSGGATGDIGLLSIDVDGNDYWIFEAIEVTSPRIVVCEFNSAFGPDRSVTIPYQADFVRPRAHWSNMYYGASVAALTGLARRKGYAFVGCTSAGNDAFFVRRDVLGTLRELSPREGWVPSRFRDSRDESGALTFVSDHAARLRLIQDLPVVDLDVGCERRIGDVFGASQSR
ncbi:MAG TPA: hypothetical protein VFM40_04430 [Actinomycetota bacterium]|nr:hypothetical protein [Actinomycetota bacterium]